mgnify:CR=1 FL=1|jgi:hypothetical protein
MKQLTQYNLEKKLRRELNHNRLLEKNLKHSNQLKVNQSQILKLKKVIAAQQQHSSAVG